MSRLLQLPAELRLLIFEYVCSGTAMACDANSHIQFIPGYQKFVFANFDTLYAEGTMLGLDLQSTRDAITKECTHFWNTIAMANDFAHAFPNAVSKMRYMGIEDLSFAPMHPLASEYKAIQLIISEIDSEYYDSDGLQLDEIFPAYIAKVMSGGLTAGKPQQGVSIAIGICTSMGNCDRSRTNSTEERPVWHLQKRMECFKPAGGKPWRIGEAEVINKDQFTEQLFKFLPFAED